MKRKLLLLSILLMSLAGCDGRDISQEPDGIPADSDVRGSTLQAEITASCACLQLDTQITSFPEIMQCGKYLVFSGWGSADAGVQIYLYDTETEELTQPFTYPAQLSEDQGCTVISLEQEDKGLRIWYRTDGSADGTAEVSYYTELWDGANVTGEEVCFSGNSSDSGKWLSCIIKDGEGHYCAVESDWGGSNIRFYDESFTEIGRIAGSMESGAELVQGSDGKLYICGEKRIEAVDPVNFQSEKLTLSDKPDNVKGCCTGTGAYILYLITQDGLYGVTARGECRETVNWIHSDIQGDNVLSAAALPDGRFCAGCMEEGILLLTPRSQEQLDAVQIITLTGMTNDSAVASAVNAFNRANSDVRIVLSDYDAYGNGENLDGQRAEFEKDLLSGTVPDIINLNWMPYENYAEKGLFEDLSPYMAELQKDEEIFQPLYDAMTEDGRLYRFTSGFQVYSVAGKTEFAGEKQGLTLAEYNSLAQSLPEDMAFTQFPVNWSVFSEFCLGTVQSFADKKTGQCYFDTPEFVEFLKFCNSFPSDRTVYNFEDDTQYLENRACLKPVFFSGGDYDQLQSNFGSDPVTLIGYPVEDGSNGGKFMPDMELAIYSQSGYKEDILEFFRFLLSEEYQRRMKGSFSVNRKVLEQQAEPELLEYMEEITVCNYTDTVMQSIIYEESQQYFAGDCTAEDAAKKIQSRVSIYLNE